MANGSHKNDSSKLTAKVTWFGLRVSTHPELSLHSRIHQINNAVSCNGCTMIINCGILAIIVAARNVETHRLLFFVDNNKIDEVGSS